VLESSSTERRRRRRPRRLPVARVSATEAMGQRMVSVARLWFIDPCWSNRCTRRFGNGRRSNVQPAQRPTAYRGQCGDSEVCHERPVLALIAAVALAVAGVADAQRGGMVPRRWRRRLGGGGAAGAVAVAAAGAVVGWVAWRWRRLQAAAAGTADGMAAAAGMAAGVAAAGTAGMADGMAWRMPGLRLVVGRIATSPWCMLAVVVERPGYWGWWVRSAPTWSTGCGSGCLRRTRSFRSDWPVRTIGSPGDLVRTKPGMYHPVRSCSKSDACRTRLDPTTTGAAAAARLTLPSEGSIFT
jgi:hypothetical protein